MVSLALFSRKLYPLRPNHFRPIYFLPCFCNDLDFQSAIAETESHSILVFLDLPGTNRSVHFAENTLVVLFHRRRARREFASLCAEIVPWYDITEDTSSGIHSECVEYLAAITMLLQMSTQFKSLVRETVQVCASLNSVDAG